MRIVYGLFLFILSCCSFACRPAPAPKHMNPRAAVGSITHFGVQFSGEYRLADMAPYQMMFLDPDQAGPHDADSITQRGGLPVAYVNIGEAESYRWYFPEIRSEWMLAPNPNWKDHFYVDVNRTEWHDLIIGKILPAAFAKGFAGVFLDMVDVSSPELYPVLQPGVVSLIREIREAHPEKIIIMNNGTFLAQSVNDVIDGIVVESVFASYNFDTKTYYRRTDEDAAYRCTELRRLMKDTGVKIFAIDYALPGDTLTAREASRLSRAQGFASFVSTIELNALQQPLY